ncbi:MAG: hypothetical protein QXY45_02285 [Candidatus Aenigmatarchaeota archaeon]
MRLKLRTISIILLAIALLLLSYELYQYLKPVNTIYFRGTPYSFRKDVRKALKVEVFPKEEFLHNLFHDYKIKNVTILFKPGSPKTNSLYQLETFEIVYKLTKYDMATRGFFKPKKTFNAEAIDSYENITREDGVLKIILVAPEFSNQTRVVGGGNRIWIYGKTDEEFDLATIRAILSIMNITSLEGYT